MPPTERLENTIGCQESKLTAAQHLLETYATMINAPMLSVTASTFNKPTISPGKRTENTLDIKGTRSCQFPSQFERIPQEPVNN